MSVEIILPEDENHLQTTCEVKSKSVVLKYEAHAGMSFKQFDVLADSLGYTKYGTLAVELAAAKENLEVANHLLQTECQRNTRLEEENAKLKESFQNEIRNHSVCTDYVKSIWDKLFGSNDISDDQPFTIEYACQKFGEEVKRLREASRAVVDLALCNVKWKGFDVKMVTDVSCFGKCNPIFRYEILAANPNNGFINNYCDDGSTIFLPPPAAPDPVLEAVKYAKSFPIGYENYPAIDVERLAQAAKLLAEKVGG